MNGQLFTATLWQMFFLLVFLFAGFLLAKIKFLPSGADKILSRLENALFVPALVFETFALSFTAERLRTAWKLFLISFAIAAVIFPIATLLARTCSKDSYLRKIYTYGLWFANFGFMGNAVMEALFKDIFLDYLIFTIPLYICIYAYAVPFLLLPPEGDKPGFKGTLKALANPMFIAMIVGAVIGLAGIPIHPKILAPISVAADCMSPIAMILTGITVANSDLGKVLRQKGVYLATALRLVIIPAVVIGIFALLRLLFFPEPNAFFTLLSTCCICAMSMPLGLNTVVVPAAYGKDTSTAAGMALVSHLCSVITIPIVITVMQLLI